nr:carboxypeptidase-like regulatory domain-containing protein [Kofleriaceae bacterium]
MLGGLVWWIAKPTGASGSGDDPHANEPTSAEKRASTGDLGAALRTAHGRTGAIDLPEGDLGGDRMVAISGTVVDMTSHGGVGNVEVVFRTPDGESSATTTTDGSYRIEVPAGTYKAFVRDDHVLSIGNEDLIRLPGMPPPDAAEVPDDALLPTVVAKADVSHIDLSVLRGGIVEGRVVDRSGHPIADAMVRARGGGVRPALATDLAQSDSAGRFTLKLPPGHFALEATHPQLAGMQTGVELEVSSGDTVQTQVTLTAGCVISGHVVTADGQPANDGAIERRVGDGEHGFGPTGKIGNDGTFRWVTSEEGEVTLRAWPWKSPHSPEQTFQCSDGARFQSVTFKLPAQTADIDGMLVDANGNPVPYAFVDLAPLDNDIAQQERADERGHWSVFSMPPGRYKITATAPGLGVVTQTVTAPIANVRLQLSGSGRVDATIAAIADGSVEVRMVSCDGVPLPHAPKLAAVVNHRVTVADVPACKQLLMFATSGVKTSRAIAEVPNDGAASVAFDLEARDPWAPPADDEGEAFDDQANAAVGNLAPNNQADDVAPNEAPNDVDDNAPPPNAAPNAAPNELPYDPSNEAE